ncbi:MAG: hypothetical protein PHU85_03965 [Phycisphaerae bacterium]|nr:hypothetical protein [Phycisphaerae bacterium]
MADVKAGRAFVDLFLKDASLVRGLAAAEAKIKAFGSRLSSIGSKLGGWGSAIAGIGWNLGKLGAAATGAFLGGAKLFGTMGGDIDDMSDRTGMGIEAIQELGYAARQNGASVEDLELGIKKMQKTIAGAGDEGKQATEALANLGLAVSDLAGLAPENQFRLMAGRIASLPDPANRTAAAIELFGRSGTKLLPMIAGGTAGLAAMAQQARNLGFVLSAEDVAAGHAFEKTLDKLWFSVKLGTARVGAQLVPMLTEFANKAIEITGVVGKWVSANQGLIVSAFKIAAGVLAAGAGIFALGKIIGGVGLAMQAFGAAISGAGVLLGVAGTAVSFLLSPLGLIVGAAVAAAGALVYFSGVGGQVGTYLSSVFGTLANDAISAFGAISKALAAGDLAAAAKVVWSLIKMEWVKGTSWILGVWAETKSSFLNIWADASTSLAKMMISGFSATQKAWISVTAALSEAWTMFTTFVGNTWDSLTGWLKKQWIELKGLIDDTVDVAAEQAAVDAGTVASKKRRTDAEAESLSKTENAARAQEIAVDETKKTMLAGVDEQAAAEKQKRTEETNATLEKLLAESEAAKREFAAATAAASAAVPTMAAGSKAPGPFEPSKLDLGGKANSAGTFSGGAAWGLGGGNVQERIAVNTEKAATFSEKMAKWMLSKNRALVFDA